MFAPRIRTKPLAELCRRSGMALEAGIDARTVWAREAERARGAMQRKLLSVSQTVNAGGSLADALAATGDFFPTLLREMVEVGEQSGHLDAVLTQLAEHYQDQVNLRRSFLAAIAWPVTQLVLSLLVVGLLIWIMGVLRDVTGSKDLDILGFGLVGNRGLAIYVGFLAGVGLVLMLGVRAIGRGVVWTRPIQRLALQLPAIGKPLRTIALSRLAWSMHLTMNAGMDVRRALRLSLRSTRNARYTDQIPAIDAEIAAGNSIHEAFCRAGGYPVEFLDTLAVGEQSGKIVESMALLSRQYREQARAALAALTIIAGWAVWLLIAAIIIGLIFRLFFFYLGALQGATKP